MRNRGLNNNNNIINNRSGLIEFVAVADDDENVSQYSQISPLLFSLFRIRRIESEWNFTFARVVRCRVKRCGNFCSVSAAASGQSARECSVGISYSRTLPSQRQWASPATAFNSITSWRAVTRTHFNASVASIWPRQASQQVGWPIVVVVVDVTTWLHSMRPNRHRHTLLVQSTRSLVAGSGGEDHHQESSLRPNPVLTGLFDRLLRHGVSFGKVQLWRIQKRTQRYAPISAWSLDDYFRKWVKIWMWFFFPIEQIREALFMSPNGLYGLLLKHSTSTIYRLDTVSSLTPSFRSDSTYSRHTLNTGTRDCTNRPISSIRNLPRLCLVYIYIVKCVQLKKITSLFPTSKCVLLWRRTEKKIRKKNKCSQSIFSLGIANDEWMNGLHFENGLHEDRELPSGIVVVVGCFRSSIQRKKTLESE